MGNFIRVLKAAAISVIALFSLTDDVAAVCLRSSFKAQVREGSRAVVRKLDDFNLNKLSIDDIKARLDALYDALQEDKTSGAYIFLYPARRKRLRFRARAFRDYLMLRGLQPTRLKIVQGGYRNEPTGELWIVPQGAEAPKAAPPPPKGKRVRH